jgi:superfamily II DNA/RNA helicase
MRAARTPRFLGAASPPPIDAASRSLNTGWVQSRSQVLSVGGSTHPTTLSGAVLTPTSTMLACSTVVSQARFVIVPMQLKAYGDSFSPSKGDRSDHLAGHLVLQKATSLKRGSKTIKTKTVDRFDEMLLPIEVRGALQSMSITVPSPIQQTAIEACLQRKDVLLASPSGEGKTVAFLAPLYANMLKDRDVYKIPLRERRPRMILLAPTRELVDQLHNVCKTFDAATGLQSQSFTSRKRAAYHLNRMLKSSKTDVLIMHPRVLLKLVRARRLFVDDIRYVAVDEADIICSSQHDHDAMHLIARIQRRNMYKHLWPVQTQFVFSTSMITRKLEYFLARKFPKLVGCFRPKAMHLPSSTVKQRFYPVQQESSKMDVLFHLLKKHGHRPDELLTEDDVLRAATSFTGFSERGGSQTGERDDGVERDDSRGGLLTSSSSTSHKITEETLDAAAVEGAEFFYGGEEFSLSGGKGLISSDAERITEAIDASRWSFRDEAINADSPTRTSALSTEMTSAMKEQLKMRIRCERIRPTAWEHLTTIAAPFTCPIQRTVFGEGDSHRGGSEHHQQDGEQGDGGVARIGKLRKRTMIFFRDIDSCTAIYHRLKSAGYPCALIHAALPYTVRKDMFARFASGDCDIVCTTDVLGRGIDMHVDLVINFHMPSTAVTYLSRLGRVGRMGRQGDVASLFTKQQGVMTRSLQALNKGDIALHHVSNWATHMKTPRHGEWRLQKMNAISRSYVSMITKKTIPAHLERTYLKHNATWRPLYHPHSIKHHGGIAPTQQKKVMERVTRDAVDFRKEILSKRKGGRAKFGSHKKGVWNTESGTTNKFIANLQQSPNPGGIGVPDGPPR